MLETLRTFALTLIVCAVLEAVIPPSKSKVAFRLLCAVVLFCTLLLPLKSFELSSLDLDALLSAAPDASQSMQSQQEAALLLAGELGFVRAGEQALSDAGIVFDRVAATCVAEKDGVALKRLEVSDVPEAQRDAARRTLSALTGDDNAQIIFTEGS